MWLTISTPIMLNGLAGLCTTKGGRVGWNDLKLNIPIDL